MALGVVRASRQQLAKPMPLIRRSRSQRYQPPARYLAQRCAQRGHHRFGFPRFPLRRFIRQNRNGASPCARLGSLPMHFRVAPVWWLTTCALLAESCTRHRLLSSNDSPCLARRNAKTSLKIIRDWSKLEATATTSPRGTASGPSSAAASPAVNVLFPFPRAMLSAASPMSGERRGTAGPPTALE